MLFVITLVIGEWPSSICVINSLQIILLTSSFLLSGVFNLSVKNGSREILNSGKKISDEG